MRKLLAMLAVILLAAPGVSKVGAQEVTVDLFYQSLEPHGEWIETADYGYVWSPREAAEDWRPYTVGSWAFTDAGWTWISEEPHGWATHHYGRWIRIESARWVWVPDTEWAPAWVSWRRSERHVGWAPLPPEAQIRRDVGIKAWSDSYYDIGPEYYSFVEVRQFGAPRLARVVVAPRENITIIRETKNITNITVVNNHVYNGGPEYDVIVRESAEPVRRLRIERRTDIAFDRGGVRQDVFQTAVRGDTLRIVAPDVRYAPSARPARVARRIEKVNVDRGWSVQGADRAQVTQLRERIREEAPKPPQELPPQPKFDRSVASAEKADRKGREGQPAEQERLTAPGAPEGTAKPGATVGTPGADDRMPVGQRPGRGDRPGNAKPDTAPGATTATPTEDAATPATERDRAKQRDRMKPEQPGTPETPRDAATPATPSEPAKPADADGEKRKGRDMDREKKAGREKAEKRDVETPGAADRDMKRDRAPREQKSDAPDATAPSAPDSKAAPGSEPPKARENRGERSDPAPKSETPGERPRSQAGRKAGDDNNRSPRGERPEQSARPDRPEKPDRPAVAPERPSRNEQPDRPSRPERPDRPERGADRPERAPQGDAANRGADRPQQSRAKAPDAGEGDRPGRGGRGEAAGERPKRGAGSPGEREAEGAPGR